MNKVFFRTGIIAGFFTCNTEVQAMLKPLLNEHNLISRQETLQSQIKVSGPQNPQNDVKNNVTCYPQKIQPFEKSMCFIPASTLGNSQVAHNYPNFVLRPNSKISINNKNNTYRQAVKNNLINKYNIIGFPDVLNINLIQNVSNTSFMGNMPQKPLIGNNECILYSLMLEETRKIANKYRYTLPQFLLKKNKSKKEIIDYVSQIFEQILSRYKKALTKFSDLFGNQILFNKITQCLNEEILRGMLSQIGGLVQNVSVNNSLALGFVWNCFVKQYKKSFPNISEEQQDALLGIFNNIILPRCSDVRSLIKHFLKLWKRNISSKKDLRHSIYIFTSQDCSKWELMERSYGYKLLSYFFTKWKNEAKWHDLRNIMYIPAKTTPWDERAECIIKRLYGTIKVADAWLSKNYDLRLNFPDIDENKCSSINLLFSVNYNTKTETDLKNNTAKLNQDGEILMDLIWLLKLRLTVSTSLQKKLLNDIGKDQKFSEEIDVKTTREELNSKNNC